jgi:hypothetical protein
MSFVLSDMFLTPVISFSNQLAGPSHPVSRAIRHHTFSQWCNTRAIDQFAAAPRLPPRTPSHRAESVQIMDSQSTAELF